jgi:hypothetical protein
LKIFEARKCCVGGGQKQIAGADSHIVSMGGPDSRLASPSFFSIVKVVVDQRGIVQQFRGGGDSHGIA